MVDLNQDQKPQNDAAGRALGALQKEYVLMGKTRIKGWHLWLAAGLLAGTVAGVFLVANKGGKFLPTVAGGLGKGRIVSVRVLSPNGGEKLETMNSYNVTWESNRFPKDGMVGIAFVNENTQKHTYLLSPSDSSGTENDGIENINIPSTIPAGSYRIRIWCGIVGTERYCTKDGSRSETVEDYSDLPFTIIVSPSYVRLSVPSNSLVNGDVVLYRFSASAPAISDVQVGEFPFIISIFGATVSNFHLDVYADSAFSFPVAYSTATSSVIVSGSVSEAPLDLRAEQALVIPAGTTRYFELRASVLNALVGSFVTTQFDSLGQQTLSK